MSNERYNSAIYLGHVRHRRWQPRSHVFRYPLFMLYLDLDELDTVFRRHWLWSTRRPALAWFRRRDYLGDPARPLADCVRDRIEQHTGRRPSGPIRLLTHLRYYGYCINPISIYYCFDERGEQVESLIAEVTNTPWGERRDYVLHDGRQPSGRHEYHFDKTLHVSPFMPMALSYHWRSNEPGERLAVHLALFKDDARQFDATLSLRRREITGTSLARVLLRYPPMTLRVVAAIYWQALRLWFKRIPFYDHPVNGKPVEQQPS